MSAEQYISKIRNPNKQQYARRYWDWLSTDRESSQPDHRSLDISTMGAQAVRINLHDIAERESNTGFRED